MTNPLIQKIAAALKAANDEIYSHVRYNVHDDNWEVWIRGKRVEVNFKSHDAAENRCEELNYEYMAGKVLEVIDEITIRCFPHKIILNKNEKLHF